MLFPFYVYNLDGLAGALGTSTDPEPWPMGWRWGSGWVLDVGGLHVFLQRTRVSVFRINIFPLQTSESVRL